MSDDYPTCSNCGAPVSPAGRRSASGKRYCTTNRDCVNMKNRENYRRRLGTQGKTEDRPCYNCGRVLEPRPWRYTDSELGRWCRRRACLDNRAIVERMAKREKIPEAEYNDLIRKSWRDSIIKECPLCFLPDARTGFQHPTPDGFACEGTGMVKPTKEMIATTEWSRLAPGNRS